MFVTLFILIPFSYGYQNYIDMAVSFYEESHVRSLCLLICDDYEGKSLKKHAVSRNMMVSVLNINKLSNAFSKFDICLTQRQATGVLIDAKCEAFEEVINYASENMMLDSKRKWLIFDYDLNTVNRNKVTSISIKNNDIATTNVAYIEDNVEINDNSTEDRDGIYKENYTTNAEDNIELSNSVVDLLESINDTGINMEFIKVEEKNILNYDFEENKVIFILNKMNISVDADITIANLRDTNIFYEVYNFGKMQGGLLVVNKIGGLHGIRTQRLRYIYYKRWDFNKLPIKLIVVMSPIPKAFEPQMILGRERDKRTTVVTQKGTQALHAISEIHNFKFIYIIVDRWVGNFQRNGTYTVTNALFFREADITPILRYVPPFIGRLDITSTPLSSIETRFYYRIPSSGAGKFENQFLTPLSADAWWGVLGVCSVCGVVLLISSLFEERPFSIPYSFFSVFALVCQQSRKITILVTGMSCVLVYNYYTSSVVSWLLNGPPPSINSLWELINSPLQPIFEDIGYTRSWLQLPNYYYNKRNSEAEDKLKQKMFKHMKKMSIFRSVDDGIELMKRGGYAYHTEVNGANERISRTFDQRELCDMGSLQSMEKTVLFAAVQQNSPYKEFFNWSLMRLRERGIISCIQNRLSSQDSKCEGSSPRALALGGAAPAFILLAWGYMLGILIMLVERYIYYYRQFNIFQAYCY